MMEETEKTFYTQIAQIQKDIEYIKLTIQQVADDQAKIQTANEKRFVTQMEFQVEVARNSLVRSMVYGVASTMLLTLISAIMYTVVKR